MELACCAAPPTHRAAPLPPQGRRLSATGGGRLRSIVGKHGAPQVRRASDVQAQAAERPGPGTRPNESQLRLQRLAGAPTPHPDLGHLQEGYAASASQLESVAPTQLAGASQLPLPPLPAIPLRHGEQQQQAWGLHHEASYYKQLDEESLLETASRQTTPAASRAASPIAASQQPWGPCTAPQPSAADLAAVITQQLAATQHTPCSEEIRRHWPHVQVGAQAGGAAALRSCAGQA